VVDLIAAAKAAAAPAPRPRRPKQSQPGDPDGASDQDAAGNDGGDDGDDEEEQHSEDDEQDEAEADVTGSGAEAVGAASASGVSLQTFVFSATLTLPQALRRRLQKSVPTLLKSACQPLTAASGPLRLCTMDLTPIALRSACTLQCNSEFHDALYNHKPGVTASSVHCATVPAHAQGAAAPPAARRWSR